MRLDKYLSECGVGTRSEVKKLLKKNVVTVNGTPVLDPKFQVPENAVVSCSGEVLDLPGKTYYMFNKPKGCICASFDPKETTIFSYIPQNRKGTLSSVGRLDKDTEGLLIVTDDGEYNHMLVSPKKHVDKIYYTEVTGQFSSSDRSAFESGLDIGDEKKTLPAKLIPLKEGSKEPWERQDWKEHSMDSGDDRAYIVLQEGRYHQVKRMAEATGHTVTYLKRVSIGSLVLDPMLKPGEYRRLTIEEIEYAKQSESLYI